MSLWDKKPHYKWVPRGYYSKVRIKDDDIKMILSDEMNVWLEKLKSQEDDLRELNRRQFQEIGRLEKELRGLHKVRK